MPAVSAAQHKLMEISAHTPGGYGGVPQSVGKEFVGDAEFNGADHPRDADGKKEKQEAQKKTEFLEAAKKKNAEGEELTRRERGALPQAGIRMDSVESGTPEFPIAPHAGPLGRAAGIMFIANDGETLLLRRGDGGDFPRTFGFPGGHLEEGETDEQASRRECLEETGFRYDGPLAKLHDDGQFTTFVASGVEKFEVTICPESTGFVWAKPDLSEAPSPLHPGIDRAFRIAGAHTELDIARLIRDGDLPSPQVFGNSMYFAMRITGTGQSFREAHNEFVHRDPSFYLTDEFLQRCNGLPVVWLHPEKNKLDTKSYAETNIGSIFLPYIKGDETWGIARVIDMVAGIELAKPGADWSTSPGVVFDGASDNVKVKLEDGSSILIEGDPALIDHLAICERGVWDKGGPASGVQVDQPIEVKMPEKTGAVADSQPSLADVMNAVNGLAGTLGNVVSRLDSVEKNMPAPALNAADSHRKDSEAEEKAREDAEEKARKDSEEKAEKEHEEKEEKARKDAEAEEKAKKDSLDRMKMDEEQAKKDAEEEEAMADCQARADNVYQMHGKRAPAKLQGETLMAYRRRLLRPMQGHSKAWAGVDMQAIGDSTAFGHMEAAIYADAAKASNSSAVGVGGTRVPRGITRRSDSGHTVTTFAGPIGGWMDDFRGQVKELVQFNKGDK